MAKKIAIIVVVLIVGLLGFAATRPDTMRVERSTRINASPEKIYPHIADFHGWAAWSPFEGRDPAMKRTYSGAPSGKGAVYEYEGNSDVGQGRMEIIETSPPGKITIQLDFIKPFAARNTAEFTLAPSGDTTTVTWAMHGPQSFFAKVMCIFVDMDSMIGKDFEDGLAKLKTLAEQ
ncbi:SRPBCC family protein [Chondromyces crocatus]|uniref:Polyketide cyclase n=1 Tax=Chondromyces crocatus TaxID=52 RepID=A0A0K1EI46_CHOCO|nr:SRPBCC family protein [Chondromyces crocatus]AKT40530.1 polyketide cyclase [Chondromyces crocatus]